MDLYSSSPDLGIPSRILLQHFYLCLSDESTQFLDNALGGAFLHLFDSEGRAILETILENSPYTDVHDDSPKEKDIPTPKQEDVLIAKSLPIPLLIFINLSLVLSSHLMLLTFLNITC
jgi:hypothetical protein